MGHHRAAKPFQDLLAFSGSDMKSVIIQAYPVEFICEISTARNNGLMSRSKETLGHTFSFLPRGNV